MLGGRGLLAPRLGCTQLQRINRCPASLRGSRPPGRLRALICRASLLPDSVDDILTTGTIVASGLAILGTAALAVRSPRKPPQPDDDEFQYGVMALVSFIPLFSWTAWVLPALQRPERAALYYSYAALYCYPLLRDGFDIEGYTLLMLALGIVHIQVERIAATEPATLQDIKPLAGLLGAVGVLAEQVLKFTGSLVGILATDTKQVITGRGGTPDGDDDGNSLPGRTDPRKIQGGESSSSGGNESFPTEADQLKEFDRRMMARDAAKRQQQNKKQDGKQRK